MEVGAYLIIATYRIIKNMKKCWTCFVLFFFFTYGWEEQMEYDIHNINSDRTGSGLVCKIKFAI